VACSPEAMRGGLCARTRWITPTSSNNAGLIIYGIEVFHYR
jgi:hypothetical protein